MAAADGETWWRRGVFYQIYPRSFQDTDGDGIGDLRGIVERLDHLVWLGVDAVWLSPIYASPMEDGGYDITDHTAVDPVFGTLEDADALLAEAHRRGLRIVLDFVPHHTSHRHPWCIESRSDRGAKRRDWYVWRDPAADGGPPTNWRSISDERPGSAWHLDERTGQYQLATFSPAQPDLNWANPAVREAMADVLRFWLDRGVDGFRIDMATFLGSDEQFRDEETPAGGPPVDYVRDARYHFNRPEAKDHLRELRAVVDGYPDRVLIAEMLYDSPIDVLVEFARDAGIDLAANFGLITQPFTAEAIAAYVEAYDEATEAGDVWPNWCLANHDMPRPTRLGWPTARTAMLLLLTLRGTPFIYYGDELGMPNVDVPPDRRDDRWSVSLAGVTRDAFRTPMRWDAGPNAGFCPPDSRPWLPVGDDHERVNVAVQRDDPGSMLHLTRRLLVLRRRTPALTVGTSTRMRGLPTGCLGFTRTARGQRMLVLCNLARRDATVELTGVGPPRIVETTGAAALTAAGAVVELGAGSAIVLQLP